MKYLPIRTMTGWSPEIQIYKAAPQTVLYSWYTLQHCAWKMHIVSITPYNPPFVQSKYTRQLTLPGEKCTTLENNTEASSTRPWNRCFRCSGFKWFSCSSLSSWPAGPFRPVATFRVSFARRLVGLLC
jgi:hypothetical protein